MATSSLEKNQIRVLLLEGIHHSAINAFEQSGYVNIDHRAGALCDDELKNALADAHILGIRSRTQLTDSLLADAKKLIAIGCFCIGTNQVDLTAAMRRGIPVFNAPFSNTRSVAELVLAEAILLLRDIPRKNHLAHQQQWHKTAANAFELRGKTLGIVGYGNIGSQFGVLAESLGMEVIYYDTSKKLSLGNARQINNLHTLLAQADAVSLHVPETAATKWMMAEAEFAAMKEKSVFINASRGSVVDIDALSDALRRDKLLGAAIDVFPEEPGCNREPFVSPLQGLPNVLLTPHIGGSTEEAQINIGSEVAEKLALYSDTGATMSSVNFPQVSLPSHTDSHRLLHIHHNVPGIMGKVNRVISEHGINISGQYLQTSASIGYAVIDVDKGQSDVALEQLKKISGTIRSRILY